MLRGEARQSVALVPAVAPGRKWEPPPTMTHIEIAENVDLLSHAVAEQFVRVTTDAIRARGRCTVALSGGSTPRSVYQLLAAPAFRSRVRWSDIHFFWGDERHVPPDHPESNYRMAVEAMLSNVPGDGNLPRSSWTWVPSSPSPGWASLMSLMEAQSFQPPAA